MLPWGSARPDNVSVSSNSERRNVLSFHSVSPFLHSFFISFSCIFFLTLVALFLWLCFCQLFVLINLLKQLFSSISRFGSATFPLFFWPSLILHLPFVAVYVWRVAINEGKHGSVRLRVLPRDGRQLSDSIVSLSTSSHSAAHAATGFLPPPIHPGHKPGRRIWSQVKARMEAWLWGLRGTGGWGPGIQAKLQTRDPDLACQAAHCRAFMAGHNIRARGEVAVSVVVMAGTRLRPSPGSARWRRSKAKVRPRACPARAPPALFNLIRGAHQRQKSMNKYMRGVELRMSDKKERTHMNCTNWMKEWQIEKRSKWIILMVLYGSNCDGWIMKNPHFSSERDDKEKFGWGPFSKH